MRKYWMATVAAAAMVAAAGTANAGTYIPVPMVPGAVSEIVFSINNSNIVAGSYRDSANVEHGFFGPLDGSNWTTFDAPFDGATGTEPRYISDDGAITGIATNPSFTVGEEFYRSPSGKFKTFNLNGKPLDGIAQGMNSDDTSVGDYRSTDGIVLGYLGHNGKYSRNFKFHVRHKGKFPQISPRGIDDATRSDVVGFFVDQEGLQHGFFQNQATAKPEDTIINYPNGESSTALEDANDELFSGQWQDSVGNFHAFILAPWSNFTDLNPQDGSSSQQAWGLNDANLVAISTNVGQSFIYCPQENPGNCPSGGRAAKGRSRVMARPAPQ